MHPSTDLRTFHGGDLGALNVSGLFLRGEYYWLVWDQQHDSQVGAAIAAWVANPELAFGRREADAMIESIEHVSSRQPGIVSIRELTPYGTGRTFSWSEAMAGAIAWLCVLLAGVVWFARAVLRTEED